MAPTGKRHSLKNWEEPFQALWDGVKTHEFRKNDRDYKVGDSIQVAEWADERERYTGRVLGATIQYISHGPDWGVPVGYCVMSLTVWSRKYMQAEEVAHEQAQGQ